MSRVKEFQAKVTEKFEEIHKRYPDQMHCGLGCHECCKPGLNINLLEAKEIQASLRADPALQEKIRALKGKNPHRGKRCSFLDEQGACAIYEVRPIICRSHGAPIQFMDPASRPSDAAVRFRDVCPLNFQKVSLKEIPANDVMNLDTINTLLALITQREIGKNTDRIELELEAILNC